MHTLAKFKGSSHSSSILDLLVALKVSFYHHSPPPSRSFPQRQWNFLGLRRSTLFLAQLIWFKVPDVRSLITQ